MTAAEARNQGVALLGGSSPSPELDVSVILSHLLKTSRSVLAAHPELELGSLAPLFLDMIDRRSRGIPVAYLTGFKEFWGLPFRITPDVLIPKPDTEILVERAVSLLSNREAARSAHMLDVCTGSGCIAVSIKHACPGIFAAATDISEPALAVARCNAAAILGASDAISFFRGDLREGLPRCENTAYPNEGGWSLIVSNPPYIPTEQAKALLEDGRSEPLLALDGGTDGLDLVKPLARHAFAALACGGRLLVETGEYNAAAAAEYFKETGFTAILIHRDLENQERVVEGMKP